MEEIKPVEPIVNPIFTIVVEMVPVGQGRVAPAVRVTPNNVTVGRVQEALMLASLNIQQRQIALENQKQNIVVPPPGARLREVKLNGNGKH